MELSMQQKMERLRAPQSAQNVSWRVGRIRADATKGQAIPYLKKHVITALLDEVFGPENWANRTIETANGFVCELSLNINGQWVTKSDAAQTDAFDNAAVTTKEYAVKGGADGAFQRAAALWGIGRYLYAFPIPWVELKDGKFIESKPKLPASLLPEGEHASAAKPTEAPAPRAETSAEAAPSPAPAAAPAVAEKAVDAPAPAPAEKPAAPAPVAKAAEPAPAPAPAAVDEDAAARARSAAAVDAEMEARASAPAPAPAPAAASSAAGGMPPGLPEGLSDEQLKTVRGLIEKINKKLSTAMLRNYVKGPKAAEALPQAARDYVLKLLDQADGKATA